MKIPMEDWLRGCVYHDGRHGEVTLSTDKVLEIANYIQMTRTSQTDGCVELPPYTVDTPQTEKVVGNKATLTINNGVVKVTPQTDVYDYKGNGKWERSE